MQSKLMIFIFAHMYEGIKLGFICLLAFSATGLAGLVETANAHPAITSVLAGGFIALSVRFVDKWLEGRNKTIKTADKVLELEQAEKKALREEHAKLMGEKESWWKSQLDRERADHFAVKQRYELNTKESREINHKAINELMRLQNIILGMQRSMVMAGMEVPEAAHIDLTRFMLPTWEQQRDEQDDDQHKTMDADPGKPN